MRIGYDLRLVDIPHYQNISKRFWCKVDKSSDCWLWTAYLTRYGYGVIRTGARPNRTTMLAHRVSWLLTYEIIPHGLCVLHKCDNPPCVNHDHLFLGTDQDNSDDKNIKGRNVILCGEKNGRAKLTHDNISEIRQRYSEGNISQKSLGAEFGVGQTSISLIIRKKIWMDD